MFEKKCEHKIKPIGTYYKEELTEYRNCFDFITVYSVGVCKLCDKKVHSVITKEHFLPELHEGRDRRKIDYIQMLSKRGILTEIEMLKIIPKED